MSLDSQTVEALAADYLLALEIMYVSGHTTDLFFDLGTYSPRGAYYSRGTPMTGGIPLVTLREFNISWAASWAGKELGGKVRFFRDYTGGVGGGWTVAPGPAWGWGWWGWPYAWPTGGVIVNPYYPWRHAPPPPFAPTG